MTPEEIRGEIESVKSEVQRATGLGLTGLAGQYLTSVAFWEIAYQLAIANEREATPEYFRGLPEFPPIGPKRHRWVKSGTDGAPTCYYCGKVLPPGKYQSEYLTEECPSNPGEVAVEFSVPLASGYRCFSCNYERSFSGLKPDGQKQLELGLCTACDSPEIGIVFEGGNKT